MKIAIASSGQNLDAAVDARFGRAPFFIIADTESENFHCASNNLIDTASGAGISAAGVVVDAGAKALVAGNCGPKATDALNAANVKIFVGFTGTVSEAIAFVKEQGL